MTLPNPPFRRTPRWARTLVLVGAVGLFPLAPAQAGEAAAKPQSDRAQRDTAPAEQNRVVERLRAAVERGDMTPEQARRTYAQLQNDRPLTDRAPRDAAPRVTDRAPDADTLTGPLRRAGVDGPMREDIVAYFQKQGVGRVQMEATLGAMVRLTHGVREQGEGFRPTDAMAEHLRREIGLDAEQSRAVLEVARKLAAVQAQSQTDRAPHAEHSDVDIRGYYLRLGLDGQAYDQVVGALREHGLGRVQVEPTLGGLFHTVLSIHEHGVEATMQDEKFRAFFTDQVGLDDEQLALVASLAQRIAAATAPAERDRPERDAAPQRRERERAERERVERFERADRERAEAVEHAEREARRSREELERMTRERLEREDRESRRMMEEAEHAARERAARTARERAALVHELEARARRIAELEQRLAAVQREREAQARRAAEQAERAERVAREQRIARERAADAERAARAREQATERERAEMREREAAAERERRVLEEREAAERERRARRDRERAERDQGEAEQGEAEDKVDFAARAERIRAAYAAGELPRVDARRELNALREQMIHQVELALEAEKITRDEAREKVEAIRAMTQLPEREGDAR